MKSVMISKLSEEKKKIRKRQNFQGSTFYSMISMLWCKLPPKYEVRGKHRAQYLKVETG
jgi:hypothetical protein